MSQEMMHLTLDIYQLISPLLQGFVLAVYPPKHSVSFRWNVLVDTLPI
jgi:hypothetical protein